MTILAYLTGGIGRSYFLITHCHVETSYLYAQKQDAKGNSGLVARQVARYGIASGLLVCYQYIPYFSSFICYKAHWVVICNIQQLIRYGW